MKLEAGSGASQQRDGGNAAAEALPAVSATSMQCSDGGGSPQAMQCTPRSEARTPSVQRQGGGGAPAGGGQPSVQSSRHRLGGPRCTPMRLLDALPPTSPSDPSGLEGVDLRKATLMRSLQTRLMKVRRPARRAAMTVQATKTEYRSPSSSTASTELERLEALSTVVPDVLLSQSLQKVEEPKAATTSRSVLAGIMGTPTSMRRFKFAIEQARFYDKCNLASGADRTSCQVDKALVNVGSMFLETVTGRVSTEVDPRIAYDTDKLVARGRSLVDMYKEVGVDRDRVLLRMPATWAAIQAGKQLEAEGIACHLVLVYSFVQGSAAAQSGVSVVQPNVGRLHDWYNRHPGVIRDPNAPTEAWAMARAGYGSEQVNPGLLLVEKIYSYVQKYHGGKTKVMASGLRTKAEALALAGCDFLVVGPKVLNGLASASTLDGYNTGLSATEDVPGSIEARLSAQLAQAAEFTPQELEHIDEGRFNEYLGMAGKDLLSEGIQRLIDDANRLEPFFLNLAGGQE
ncbi:putative transaldolase [Chlorella sorokiniana]|uniref:Transaldolase n=1 Tax=Chlorella sorokiniana TaxID=3076 RepID=A0A2P6U4I7_CHLSO|nr:putative transaldolase [Chlorella sorokiniana]|eukprot:PRW61225.1 putative transaldolase [Chlorella sorokiniana]